MNKVLAVSLLSLSFSTAAFADDLLSTIEADKDYSTFTKAIKTAGIENSFKGDGPLTVFIPNNAAFEKMPKAKLNKLLSNKDELAKVLQYHIVGAKITSADVAAGKVKTVEGEDLPLSVTDGVKVGDARVVGTEIHADNGAIHTVDTVLIPKKN
ncbi:MAG TPA: fasciclin domain-containing protein [Methylophilaceae bacterium]|nr:fasciclin domain-containing protein [Methylophilaceae bacterium]